MAGSPIRGGVYRKGEVEVNGDAEKFTKIREFIRITPAIFLCTRKCPHPLISRAKVNFEDHAKDLVLCGYPNNRYSY